MFILINKVPLRYQPYLGWIAGLTDSFKVKKKVSFMIIYLIIEIDQNCAAVKPIKMNLIYTGLMITFCIVPFPLQVTKASNNISDIKNKHTVTWLLSQSSFTVSV